MSVFENMAFSLKMAGKDKGEIAEAVNKAAAILQITELLQRKPKDLSGGQRQRVAIGRAIVRQPKLFLFDEPLSNLDASLRVQMRIELARLHKALKTTMIYVTHDQVEAMTLGERIVVFNGGHIEQIGAPLELYERPANLFVAGFLGAPKMNIIAGKVVNITAQEVSVELVNQHKMFLKVDASRLKVGDSVKVGCRAEHVLMSDSFSPRENSFTAECKFVEHLGDAAIVYATLADRTMLAVKNLESSCSIPMGSSIQMSLPSERCHLFDTAGRVCIKY
jgi:multiple sugar transport system ATP-binding protein